MDADLKVPARYYARLAGVSAELADGLEAALHRIGIAPQLLSQPDAMIPVSKVDQLLGDLSRNLERTDLGFEVGKQLSANAHSFVGFGMLNSATLDEALRFEAQYFRLVMPSFSMRYVSRPDYGEMQFRPRVAMSHLSLSFHLEAIGMAALREVSDLTGGRRPPCRLDLSIPEPPHLRRYQRELKDVRVRFEASTTPSVMLRILAPPKELHLEMADSHALRVAEDRCRSLVQKAADGGRFADWVAMTLREVADGLPTQKELAAQLNMSTRTLHRYLEHEGTSFRALASRIQHDIACERLGRGMSANEVAYSLGFADPSNFNRAFRIRAGYSPGRHRSG
ncbi:AraC family transcriptional regulator [Solimonas fluminis]|uniref:AraC family transcriptional regulator n=1 Tax=Solimonas fluminis TaxID=2086571 RepID=A0A2S5THH0_9GAMM|nr:AraC family transcriptional regulator [Solimonas fluminis]PPE74434.1 AraC family transcriptional regulator [Solimonas fluminis]